MQLSSQLRLSLSGAIKLVSFHFSRQLPLHMMEAQKPFAKKDPHAGLFASLKNQMLAKKETLLFSNNIHQGSCGFPETSAQKFDMG